MDLRIYYLNSCFDTERPKQWDFLETKRVNDAVDRVNVHVKMIVWKRLILDWLPQRLWRQCQPVKGIGAGTSGCGPVAGKLLALSSVSPRSEWSIPFKLFPRSCWHCISYLVFNTPLDTMSRDASALDTSQYLKCLNFHQCDQMAILFLKKYLAI